MALAVRTLMGLLNGNAGIIRTMISEVATEKRHQALAFAAADPLVYQAYQSGSSIGPLSGGHLAASKEMRFTTLNSRNINPIFYQS